MLCSMPRSAALAAAKGEKRALPRRLPEAPVKNRLPPPFFSNAGIAAWLTWKPPSACSRQCCSNCSGVTSRNGAGRLLPASGGIVPDVMLGRDTSSGAESLFARALDGHVSEFRDALTAYALDLRKARLVTRESFTVTPEMRAEVGRRLAALGVALDDSVYAGGARLVDEQLGYEIARYVFGPAAERRRRPPIQRPCA